MKAIKHGMTFRILVRVFMNDLLDPVVSGRDMPLDQ